MPGSSTWLLCVRWVPRGDDASTLKCEVIHWITANAERVEPPLSPRDKETRGLNHLLTGRLLCPVDYDWADPRLVWPIKWCLKTDDLIDSMCTSVREYHPDFHVTAYSWPLFLYKGYVYDPNDPSSGLFQSDLLVKVCFRSIQTICL